MPFDYGASGSGKEKPLSESSSPEVTSLVQPYNSWPQTRVPHVETISRRKIQLHAWQHHEIRGGVKRCKSLPS